MRYFVLVIYMVLAWWPNQLFAQVEEQKQLTFEQFMTIVRTQHPVAKQAELLIDQANSARRAARGSFDPELFTDIQEKDLSGTDYFRLIESGLKIPTWFGVDIKAGYEQNRGVFLNPADFIPPAGLWFAEIKVPLGEGLFIDKRRAEVKKAELFSKMNEETQKVTLNDLLYDSGTAYWEWFKSYNALSVYENALELSQIRYDAVLEGADLGERPAIDTLEARIQVQNRQLNLQQAQLDYDNATAQLSVFLWANGIIPLEVEKGTVPPLLQSTPSTQVEDMYISGIDTLIQGHPLLAQTQFKIDQLRVDVRLKKEELKPTLNLSYKPITEPVGGDVFSQFSSNNFEWGLEFSLPIFLRKERGNIKLAQLKVRDNELEFANKQENLLLKARKAINEWSTSYQQIDQFEVAVDNYSRLLQGEQRKFETGESSLFLVNSRETSLITAQVKLVDLYTKNGKASLKTKHAFGRLEQIYR